MKKIFILSTLLISSSSIYAVLPPFTAQNLLKYEGKKVDHLSRLRVNLSVSSKTDTGEINVSDLILCSASSCWKAEVNKYIPVANSSTTRGQLIADVLIPENEQINHIIFEPTTGKQSIEGELKLVQPVKMDSEYQGTNLYIVLNKIDRGNGVARYQPMAATALPYNPEAKYYLVDPKFNQSINLNSKSSITFPSSFLNHPQLYIITEHNVGKKFPMLDIYPYVKGNGNLKIKIAEKDKKTATTTLSSNTTTSIAYSEISESSTRVIEGSDYPSNAAQKVSLAAAATTCSSTITANLASYRTTLQSTGVARISACENIAPNIHIAFINAKDTRIKYALPLSVSSTASVPHQLNLVRMTNYGGIALVNGFMWDGDAGALSGGHGTAKGFLNTDNVIRAKNTDGGNKLTFGVSSTKGLGFFETSSPTYNFQSYGYNLISSSTSVVKNGVCTTSTENNRWSAIGANLSTGEIVMVSSTSSGTTTAANLCSVFKAFGINYAIRLDGGPSAAMIISGTHLNPLTGASYLKYGSMRYIAYPIQIKN
ncbi:phosphodiester glycosidase family protein [Acinetobacter lactucae]|uniref:Phosphodiester glycosidase domain-containing protein n=1 Tax=Acinetobacter lactucae TaxID=1785128 RepID=R8YVW2_9GAMM|nr:phosphodiester glycosidase family protein [Acinetobacter lactucae]EOQ73540.1 hypothetical protein F929_03483 [Acinetobacter lactucae]